MRLRVLFQSRFFLSLFFAVMLIMWLSGCASVSGENYKTVSVEEKQLIVQRLINNEDFLGLFRNAHIIADKENPNTQDGNFIISTSVNAYFDAHNIETPERTVSLLKSRGFKVSAPAKYKRAHDGLPRKDDPPFDVVIYAKKRGGMIKPFVWKQYAISLYVYNGKVEKVMGRTVILTM